MSEEKTLRRAGVSFGEKETYRVFTALKKFVQTRNAGFARFWGKIFGTQKDYYVIETKVDPPADLPEITESHEPREQGVNKKIFFVSTNSSGFFTQFPTLLRGWSCQRFSQGT